jgi:outer membrane receptor protein involved in Fe transport
VGPARVAFDAAWPLPRWVPRGSAGVRVRWSDAAHGIASALERHAFWTTSLEVGCEPAMFRAQLAIRNLFDADYQEPLSFIPEPGRTFVFSISRDFSFAPTRPEDARR